MLFAEPALAVTCAPCLLLACWWYPMMTLGVTVANLPLCGLSHAQLQSIFCWGSVLFYLFELSRQYEQHQIPFGLSSLAYRALSALYG